MSSKPAINNEVAIGLRINGLEGFIGKSLLRTSRLRRAQSNLCSGLELVDSVGHDDLFRHKAVRDCCLVSLGSLDFDIAGLHRIVRFNNVHERRLRAVLDRSVRNEDCVADRIHQQTYINELIGEEGIVRVRKQRLELDCTGSRIDLIVDRQQRSRRELVLQIAIVSFGR